MNVSSPPLWPPPDCLAGEEATDAAVEQHAHRHAAERRGTRSHAHCRQVRAQYSIQTHKHRNNIHVAVLGVQISE